MSDADLDLEPELDDAEPGRQERPKDPAALLALLVAAEGAAKRAQLRVEAMELERATFVRHIARLQARLDGVVGYCAKLQGIRLIETGTKRHGYERDPVPRELLNR